MGTFLQVEFIMEILSRLVSKQVIVLGLYSVTSIVAHAL